MINAYKKGDNKKLSKNFSSNEFDCNCERASCKTTLISQKLVEGLQMLRDTVGPLKITSGFRCCGHNKAIGGADNSQHTIGLAADVVSLGKVTPQVIQDVAQDIFQGVGSYSTFTHVDVRVTGKAGWSG